MQGPRILLLDIETSPNLVWSWGVYQQDAIAMHTNWYILSFAFQWRHEAKIGYHGLDEYKGYKGGSSTEQALLADLHCLLSEADVVVAHNGADFDVKKINARFIERGFSPPAPYKLVDTKRDLVRVASFASNRLNWLSKQLEIGRKTMEHQDFAMWEGCMAGDRGAWRKMRRYNIHDVRLLGALYGLLSPWIKQPNANLWSDGKPRCSNPNCRSANLERRGVARSKTRSYQRYQCRTCGSWSRSTKSEKGSASLTQTTTDVG